MPKPAFFALAASALALPAATMAGTQVNIAPAGPVVELNVYEAVTLAPDQATISAGVTTEAPKATDAMRQNAQDMAKLIAKLKALGIPDKDIQTTGINLGAQYDFKEPETVSGMMMPTQVFRGYQASNRVSVTLRKIDDTGRILDALVEAGATDLGGPVFEVSDDAAAKEQARTRAVARGEAQAKAYAKMLGYTGVKVLSVSESVEAAFPMFEAKAAAEVAATASPVQPGMISSGVNVTITYELTGKAG